MQGNSGSEDLYQEEDENRTTPLRTRGTHSTRRGNSRTSEIRQLDTDLPYTPEQMQALVDAKIREIDARIAIENNRAIAERARLDALNNANIAAITTGKNSDAGNDSLGSDGQNDGEVPSEVSAVLSFYPGLPADQIIANFRNKFRPKNIYKLSMLGDFDDEDNTREVVLSDGKLRLNEKKYRKEFGNDASI